MCHATDFAKDAIERTIKRYLSIQKWAAKLMPSSNVHPWTAVRITKRHIFAEWRSSVIVQQDVYLYAVSVISDDWTDKVHLG